MKKKLALTLAVSLTMASVLLPANLSIAETVETEYAAEETVGEETAAEEITEEESMPAEEMEAEEAEAESAVSEEETEVSEEQTGDEEEDLAEPEAAVDEENDIYKANTQENGAVNRTILDNFFEVGSEMWLDLKEYDEELKRCYEDQSYLFLGTELPDGLIFDPDTLTISGTPETGGVVTIDIILANYDGTFEFEIFIYDINNPDQIYTVEMRSAVKYVPYSANLDKLYGKQGWLGEMEEVQLPDGMSIDYKNNRVKGTPQSTGEYTLKTYEFLYEEKQVIEVDFILKVLDNTDSNVLYATDFEEGYGFEDYVGIDMDGGRFELDLDHLDQGDGELFVSSGSMDEFVNLWINGMAVSTDLYTANSGSTRIVLSEELLTNSELIWSEGPNTIAMEFDTGDRDDAYQVKVTAQNFYPVKQKTVTPTPTATPAPTVSPRPTATSMPEPTATAVPAATATPGPVTHAEATVAPAETGDETNIAVWFALAAVSMFGIVLGIGARKKNR